MATSIDNSTGVYVAKLPGETYNYKATSTTAQTVYLTDGGNTFNDLATSTAGNVVTVYGGAGNDTFTNAATGAGAATMLAYGGAGNDAFTITGANGGDTLVGGAGNDSYDITATDGTKGKELIIVNSGDGNDTITGFSTTNANATVQFNVAASDLSYTASGTDLLVKVGSTGQVVKLAGLLAADFSLVNFKDVNGATLTGTIHALAGGAAAAAGTTNLVSADNVTVDYDLAADATTTTKIVGTGVKETLNITGAATGKSVNLSGSIYSGFNNITDNSTGANYLRGDGTNNSITGAAGDQLWGGAGSDTLDGNSKGTETYWFGSADGADVVKNTKSTDIVYLYDGTASNVTYQKTGSTGTDLLVTVGSTGATLTISGYFTAANDTTGNANAPQIKLANGTVVTPVLANAGGNTTYAYDPTKNYGVIAGQGTGNTITAAGVTQSVTINLYDTTKFTGIQKIIGSGVAGDYLRGDSANNTVTAGAVGGANIWGGVAGNDTLVSAGTNNTFWFGTGDSNDVLQASGATDTINLYNINRSAVTAAVTGAGLVVGAQGDTVDSLTVTTSAGKFKSADGKVFSIDTGAGAIAYTDGDLVVGTGSAASVTGAAKAVINLYDTTQFVNVNTATGGGAGYVRGNSANNTLTAAAGDQLWGAAGNDTLVSGGGTNTFWFGAGDGNDKITGATGVNTNTINLYNVNASQLSYALDASGNLKVTIAGDTADSLTVTGGTYNNLTFLDQTGKAFQAYVADDSTTAAISVAGAKQNAIVVGGTGNHSVTGYANSLQLGKIALGGTGNTVVGTANTTINLYDTTQFSGVQNATGGGAGYVRGTADSNVLTAAAGDQLWGAAGNDSLMGAGAGNVTYWFGTNDGADKVFNSSATDTVMLYDSGLSASNVGVAVDTNGALNLTIGSGTLSIQGWNATTSVNTFNLGGNLYTVKQTTSASGSTYSLVQK